MAPPRITLHKTGTVARRFAVGAEPTPCYRLNADDVADMLREAAVLPECATMSDSLDDMADRFCDGGEPWTTDDQGRDLYDLTDFDVAVIRAAQKAVGKHYA